MQKTGTYAVMRITIIKSLNYQYNLLIESYNNLGIYVFQQLINIKLCLFHVSPKKLFSIHNCVRRRTVVYLCDLYNHEAQIYQKVMKQWRE